MYIATLCRPTVTQRITWHYYLPSGTYLLDRGLSHSYSIHSSALNGAWNHMLWSREAAMATRNRGKGFRDVISRAKSEMYAATHLCKLLLFVPDADGERSKDVRDARFRGNSFLKYSNNKVITNVSSRFDPHQWFGFPRLSLEATVRHGIDWFHIDWNLHGWHPL